MNFSEELDLIVQHARNNERMKVLTELQRGLNGHRRINEPFALQAWIDAEYRRVDSEYATILAAGAEPLEVDP